MTIHSLLRRIFSILICRTPRASPLSITLTFSKSSIFIVLSTLLSCHKIHICWFTFTTLYLFLPFTHLQQLFTTMTSSSPNSPTKTTNDQRRAQQEQERTTMITTFAAQQSPLPPATQIFSSSSQPRNDSRGQLRTLSAILQEALDLIDSTEDEFLW